MSLIKFPGIYLSFTINKIAFIIGNVVIYKYAIIIACGIVLSIILFKFSKNKFNINYEFFLETLVYILIFGIIGARLYYVLFNLKYYSQNVWQIFNLRNGGLAIYGGILVGIVIAIYRCKKNKVNMFDFLDAVIPYLALTQSIGRWGNFFNIEAYGTKTNSIFRMGITTAQEGYIEVHPVFLYESIYNLFLFYILKKMQKNRKFEGQIVLIYLIMYSFVRFFLELLRIDSLMFFGIKISCLISTIIFVISLILYLKKDLNCRKKS